MLSGFSAEQSEVTCWVAWNKVLLDCAYLVMILYVLNLSWTCIQEYRVLRKTYEHLLSVELKPAKFMLILH